MITTYDSNCMPCLNGAMHPTHDNGAPVDVFTEDDLRFSQLPPEPEEQIGLTLAGHTGVVTTKAGCGCNCHG